ncbi:MAG: hypothetical protein JWO69_199 [Thermoleophilia bacterium]|nr:hypothetical protein [Thermoleophilia bacterium]
MDDHDLDALHAYRAGEATPPPGLQERLEEDLWQSIMAEEARLRSGGRRIASTAPARRWFQGLLRPAMAAGAAAAVAVTVAVWSDGGTGPVTAPATGVSQAGTNVLDATAARLFGSSQEADVAVAPPIAGTVDATEGDDNLLLTGPTHAGSGMSDETSRVVRELPRDPARLHELITAAAAEAGDDELVGRTTFHITMRWVIDPTVPLTVRATMLSSLGGLAGIDQAVTGVDIIGRQGVVVSHHDPNFGLREQYVLSAEGAQLLERRAFTAGSIDPACPDGIVTDHVLYGSGEPIERDRMSWAEWPQVIPSCDRATSAAGR